MKTLKGGAQPKAKKKSVFDAFRMSTFKKAKANKANAPAPAAPEKVNSGPKDPRTLTLTDAKTLVEESKTESGSSVKSTGSTGASVKAPSSPSANASSKPAKKVKSVKGANDSQPKTGKSVKGVTTAATPTESKSPKKGKGKSVKGKGKSVKGADPAAPAAPKDAAADPAAPKVAIAAVVAGAPAIEKTNIARGDALKPVKADASPEAQQKEGDQAVKVTEAAKKPKGDSAASSVKTGAKKGADTADKALSTALNVQAGAFVLDKASPGAVSKVASALGAFGSFVKSALFL